MYWSPSAHLVWSELPPPHSMSGHFASGGEHLQPERDRLWKLRQVQEQVKKQHILDEVRRTAAENGGVALGRAAFENQTGNGFERSAADVKAFKRRKFM